MIVVIGVRSGFIWDKVRFRAMEKSEEIVGHLLGTKRFWINKNQSVTVRMSKNEMWEVGDKVDDLSKLLTINNQLKFNWDWV